MKVREAARRLEVSTATIYNLVASGKLRCSRVGVGRGVIRIQEDHLAEYLRRSEPVSRQSPIAASSVRLKHVRLG